MTDLTKPSKKSGLNSQIVAHSGLKKIYKTHGVSSRTQIKSVYSGEQVKRKLSTNLSKYKLTFTLKRIIAVNKSGLNIKTESKCVDEKHTFEMYTTSPRAQIATDRRDEPSNESPMHLLQLQRAYLWPT